MDKFFRAITVRTGVVYAIDSRHNVVLWDDCDEYCLDTALALVNARDGDSVVVPIVADSSRVGTEKTFYKIG